MKLDNGHRSSGPRLGRGGHLPTLVDLHDGGTRYWIEALRIGMAVAGMASMSSRHSLLGGLVVVWLAMYCGLCVSRAMSQDGARANSHLAVAADTLVAALLVQLTGKLASPVIFVLYLPLLQAALTLSIRALIGIIGWTTLALIVLGTGSSLWRIEDPVVYVPLLNYWSAALLLLSSLATSRLIIYRHQEKEKELRQDINNLEHTKEQYHYLAKHDSVTGLANRVVLQERMQQILTVCSRHHRLACLLIVDLDHFKLINDEWGHHTGDLLLRAVAERILSCIRQDDVLARTGSDEFAVALPDINSTQDATGAARKILGELSKPFDLQGREVHITGSAGISIYPTDGQDMRELIRNAEIALRAARDHGTNAVQLHTPLNHGHSIERVKLEADLRSAISRDEFELYYHPQVDVETARLIGLEALIRWNHPRLGLVSPVRFISLAEETGLIVPLTEWVLRRACEQNKEWQNLGFPVVRIAVNLSPRQFQQRVVVPAVVKALQLTGLQPHCLEVEITESAAMQDADYTITAIRALQEMGVEVAMDDFGTGFSSLSHLKRLPFDTIKIDQTFVRDIATDPGSAAIVATIIDLTHNLGRKVIAEGVENEQQLLFLRMHGCHRIQGYLISKPMPAQELTRLLATRGPGAVNRVAPEAGAETLAEIIAHYSYPLPSPERLTGGITAVR